VGIFIYKGNILKAEILFYLIIQNSHLHLNNKVEDYDKCLYIVLRNLFYMSNNSQDKTSYYYGSDKKKIELKHDPTVIQEMRCNV
jgi:hypothetical protein